MTSWAGRGALAAGALLGAGCALALGQDSGHDLRNYHWYNPWALLNGRLSIDLAPAQLQTYFNPSLDLLYYGLIQGPVSYTHLRAHETREDLVCRLLLEKKKN